jgi:CRP-like cAMP-binding protein
VRITKGANSFEIAEDTFIGEIGYLTGNPASAKAELSRDCVVLEWDVSRLRKRARRDPRFKLALEALISLDLAEKVSRSVRIYS